MPLAFTQEDVLDYDNVEIGRSRVALQKMNIFKQLLFQP